MNKNIFPITFMIIISILFVFSVSTAAEDKTPKEYVEYIYENYADQNFKEVYANFALEVKQLITEKEYIEFQKQNFSKYSLEYSNINVDDLKELDYDQFKDEFPFLKDEGDFYSLKVSYLLRFKRFGDREEETEKRVYLRSNNFSNNNKVLQLFWDPEPILKNKNSESVN